MFVVMLSLSVSNVYPIETAGIYDTTLLYCSIRFWAPYLYTPTVSNVYPIETAGKQECLDKKIIFINRMT
jgi:hypothetical protein